MKILTTVKDGGNKSTVWAHILFEIKSIASVMLLRFEDGSREAYHTHAFNCFSWVLRGKLVEHHLDGRVDTHKASWLPFITRQETFHQVRSSGRTWVLTFRGPWTEHWFEWLPNSDQPARPAKGVWWGSLLVLEAGRRIVFKRICPSDISTDKLIQACRGK